MNKRIVLLILGHISFGLGIIGAMLPVIPTTPFLILAAYCYSKSSPKLHQKILNLPHVGIYVREWEEHGVISVKAKLLCVLMLTLMLGTTMYFSDKLIVKIILPITGVAVAAFVLSRPSEKKKS